MAIKPEQAKAKADKNALKIQREAAAIEQQIDAAVQREGYPYTRPVMRDGASTEVLEEVVRRFKLADWRVTLAAGEITLHGPVAKPRPPAYDSRDYDDDRWKSSPPRGGALGDRMKAHESVEAMRRLDPALPVCIRLDGRAFHTFTRGLTRPFDAALHGLMVDVAAACVAETNALVGYTQSDEITLVLHVPPPSELYFGGRAQKIVSALAAFASVRFNRDLAAALPAKAAATPTFDARAWSVPTREEAANCVLWREFDATKNAISMAAQAVFSHKQLQGLHGDAQLALLRDHGINFDAYPTGFTRGTYVRRIVTSAPFTAAEIDALPPQHNARRNPGLVVTRSRVERVVLPPLATVANRVAVLFDGAAPEVIT